MAGIDQSRQASRLARAWAAREFLFKGAVGCGVLTWATYGSAVQVFGASATPFGLDVALGVGAVAGLALAWRSAA